MILADLVLLWRTLMMRFLPPSDHMVDPFLADRREFIKISQAVGVGFLVMGAVGYLVKLSTLDNLVQ